MKIQQIVNRCIFGTLGLFKELAEIVNRRGRDAENRHRFPHAVIDEGVCMTPDTIIGKHAHIMSNTYLNHVQIGDYSYISQDSIVQNTTIGNYCSISYQFICGLGNHPIDRFSTSPIFYRKNSPINVHVVEDDKAFADYKAITIGNDVWIGQNVTIMPGVHIGDGAIIGTNATVAKDIPPYTIAVGNPAQVIKKRFDDEMIDYLLKLKWWDWPIEKIEANFEALGSSDLEIIKKLKIDDMIKASDRTGKFFTVHQNRRYDPDYLTVKRIYEEYLY